MNNFIKLCTILGAFVVPVALFAQNERVQSESLNEELFKRPSYCDQPTDYSSVHKKLPEIKSTPTVGYKVQVALLKHTDPTKFGFSRELSARWDPCSEYWLVESKQIFEKELDAQALVKRLQKLKYPKPIVVKVILYQ